MSLNYKELRDLTRQERGKSIREQNNAGIILAVCIILAALLIATARADVMPMNEETAVKAIIGEAESEGYRGMLALACALRNRGTFKGVYGINSRRVINKLYNTETDRLARLAWKNSAHSDITDGAIGWGNESDLRLFMRQRWFKHCVITCKIKNHWFYKEVAK